MKITVSPKGVLLLLAISLVVLIAARQAETTTYTVVSLYGQGTKINLLIDDGNSVETIQMKPGETATKYINRMVADGYAVDQWIMSSQTGGSAVVQTICVLRN